MDWHSIHVHYHDANLDGLILDAVRPLFRLLDQDASGYFVRHWRLGPHLRINLHTTTETFETAVLPAARDVIGRFLTEQPSRAVVDPRHLLGVHQRLAELEQEDGPLLPWRPDNSIHVMPHDRRVRVLGSEAAADLLAGFLTDTTPAAFAMLDHVRAGNQRLGLAFDLMVAAAHAISHRGIVGGFGSFRSHAEAFLCGRPEGHGRREVWDERYRAGAADLVRRVRQVVATIDDGLTIRPFVGDWARVLAQYQARGRALIDAGEVSMEPPVTAGSPLADVSPFHRAVEGAPWWEQVRTSAWFAAYRLALNYHYLQLTRLGVAPVERFMLCHLVANAVEECYGASALDLVDRPDIAAAWLAGGA